MKKKITLIFALVLMVILVTTLIGQCEAKQKVYNWEFFVVGPLDQGYGTYLAEFADNVKESSEGRLVITCRNPGELPYKGQDALRIVSDRSVELADMIMNFFTNDFKIGSIQTWPLLCSNKEDLFKAVEIVKPYIAKRAKDYNQEELFWAMVPAQRFWGRGKPIHKLSDLKNVKVRTSSIQQQRFLRSVKGIPVAMPANDIPTSMTRNLIQAAITGAYYANATKWDEFIDWGYVIPFGFSSRFIMVNSEALAELPEDLKEILFEEGRKTQRKMFEGIPIKDSEAIEELRQKGVQIIEPDPDEIKREREIMKPLWLEWAKEIGPEGEEVLAKIMEAIGK